MKRLFWIFLVFVHTDSNAQPINYGKDLKIEELTAYRRDIKEHPDRRLIEILPKKTGINLDIRYATNNNFMGQPMYAQARAFAISPAYNALLQIQQDLVKQGLGLKIFDGYRPYSVTVKFYEMAKDTTFVADPRKGSRHNRGCAIDLTLMDLKTGKDLEMPTGYDSFSRAAAATYDKANPLAIANRQILQNVMLAHGFQIFPSEWWHFDFIGWDKFPLMNIPFADL